MQGEQGMQGEKERLIKFSLAGAEATRSLGITLGRSLKPGTVIFLEGDLGSGKTTLVQGMGTGLGITESIVSPTFTLINEYTEGRLPLYHLDLYRLQLQEVAAMQLESYWEGIELPLGIVAIEWADRLDYKPPSYLRICLTYQGDDERIVEFFPIGEFQIDYLLNQCKNS
ncbi:MAG TPA: tRNA (adenosine(37)-N6)-threonylcarbamoyltransferase complex ATPase subunit type 1 TsaE [Leptolyngbyaceae cyanobacterium]